ncbi:hypothetical protein HHK36_020417 [Tetracentron sinense]|uniref:Uncharacterized protein n=1 Tax=Tetracentron sinense TaxID=13715 RepID=A0A834YV41_TETSI|nr:hypothetical protein HHK36_020417 [Tetracentron sinense]
MDSPSVLLASLLVCLVMVMGIVAPQVEARTFFVFGDSLVDNGNNNYLATSARANMPPYGIDFPTHIPTGRFSNGLSIPDVFSWVSNLFSLLSLSHVISIQCERIGAEEYTLPYLSPALTGQRLLVGANFASAGIGILNDTGIQFVNIIRMFAQFQFFQQYQLRLTALVGADRAQQIVKNALVLITLGGNDFVNNYYLVPYSARSRQFSLPDYVRYLISQYKKILQRLYELGARRVIVTGTGPMGCAPAELAQKTVNGQCEPNLQRASALYNPQLIQMIKSLNSEIGSDVFIAANTLKMQQDVINNPQKYGFVTSKIACCGQGPFNGLGLCTAISNVCADREIYVFWDNFHPTERGNRVLVQQIMSGSTDYMYPMNLSTIMAIDSRT